MPSPWLRLLVTSWLDALLAVKEITPTSSDQGACGGDSLNDGGLPETHVTIGIVGLI